MNDSRYSDPAWRAVEQDRREEHGQRLVLWTVLASGPHYNEGVGSFGDSGDGGGGVGGYGNSGYDCGG